MISPQIVPAIVIPYIGWRVYRHYRRSVGRQRLHLRRLTVLIAAFSLISVAFGLAALDQPPALRALAGGLLLAVPLALAGLQLTKFETTPEGRFYTPNAAIGVGLIVLFAGRSLYRMYVLFVAPPANIITPRLFQSPLSLLIFGLTAGYYIAYYTGVILYANKPA